MECGGKVKGEVMFGKTAMQFYRFLKREMSVKFTKSFATMRIPSEHYICKTFPIMNRWLKIKIFINIFQM